MTIPNSTPQSLNVFAHTSVGPHVHKLHTAIDSPHKPLALIVSNVHNSREVSAAMELSNRLISCLGKKTPSIDMISAQSSTALMRGPVSDMLNYGTYGGVITFGGWAASAVSHEFERANLRIPFIYTNMHEVYQLPIHDIDHPGYGYGVGITVKHPMYTKVLGLLGDWCPRARRALVIVSKWQSEQVSSALRWGLTRQNIAACESQGIIVEPLYVYDDQDLAAKLDTRLNSDTDIILTGENSLALANSDLISHFAEMRRTPVITQSLEMILRGHAALGCGVWGSYSNGLITKLLIDLLENGVEPKDIPLNRMVSGDRVRYKKKVLEKQGLEIKPDQERALDAQDIDQEMDIPDTLINMSTY